MILEEVQKNEKPIYEPSIQILPISARSNETLKTQLTQLSSFLKSSKYNFEDIAFTLQVGRKHFKERAFIIAKDKIDASSKIEEINCFATTTEKVQYIFMFPGQGSQYRLMSKDLYIRNKTYKKYLDICATTIQDIAGIDILEVLFKEDSKSDINSTSFAQLAIFAVSYSLAKTIIYYGIEPTAAIGHSLGEYVAATISGVFSLKDAVFILDKRSKLMQSLPTGKMIAVSLPPDETMDLLHQFKVSLAAVNSGKRCVLSGETQNIEEIQEVLKKNKIPFKQLETSHAFHSQMMSPILGEFESLFSNVSISDPKSPFSSNLNGMLIHSKEQCGASYWKEHLYSCVNFHDSIKKLSECYPNSIFLEIGPGKSLSDFSLQSLGFQKANKTVQFLGVSSADNSSSFLKALGILWANGANPDWEKFNENYKYNRIPIAIVSFQERSVLA